MFAQLPSANIACQRSSSKGPWPCNVYCWTVATKPHLWNSSSILQYLAKSSLHLSGFDEIIPAFGTTSVRSHVLDSWQLLVFVDLKEIEQVYGFIQDVGSWFCDLGGFFPNQLLVIKRDGCSDIPKNGSKHGWLWYGPLPVTVSTMIITCFSRRDSY